MPVAQSGILALGTSSHAYLEFDRVAGTTDADLVAAAAELAATVKTTGATGLVVGLRPELWAAVAPGRGAGRTSTATTRTWSAPTGSPCPPPSTTSGSG